MLTTKDFEIKKQKNSIGKTRFYVVVNGFMFLNTDYFQESIVKRVPYRFEILHEREMYYISEREAREAITYCLDNIKNLDWRDVEDD